MSNIIKLLYACICFPIFLDAQVDNIWVLGANSSTQRSRISFDFDSIFVSTLNSNLWMDGGNSSICDKYGQLQLYTNGAKIYGPNHQLIENGDSISIGYIQNLYSSLGNPWVQSALILPMPTQDSVYVQFNNDMWPAYDGDSLSFPVAPLHLLYHIVDMRQNSGLGKVISKNNIAVSDTLARLNIQAQRHRNGTDWWVIVPESHSNCYYVCLLDSSGVSAPKKYCLGHKWTDADDFGQAVFSPNGKLFARVNFWNGLNIYGFDDSTGELSKALHFDFVNEDFLTAGAAFSSNSRYLYVTSTYKIFQYDMDADDIIASRITVAEYDGHTNTSPTHFYQAVLAPDKKIYISTVNSTYNLHVIHRPNCPGLACLVEQHGITLPALNHYSMPNLPHYDHSFLSCDSTTSNTIPAYERLTSIFPNPFSDQLTIKTSNLSAWKIQIFNSAGRLQTSASFSTLNKTITTHSFPSGLYFYKIIDDQGNLFTGKLLKA